MDRPQKIELIRYKYTENATFGKFIVYSNSGVVFECETMEDVTRPLGVKVKNHTAIFAGNYFVTVTRSGKFKRNLPYIHNTIGFTGVRLHSGNTVKHTAGCPLIGTSVDYANERISGGSTIEKNLTSILKGHTVPISIKNGMQQDR